MKHILLCLVLVAASFVASCKKSEAPKEEAKPAEAAEKAPEAKK